MFWFFFLLLPHVACEFLVRKPRVRRKLLRWELRVGRTGLTENLRPQQIFIRVRSHRGPHLSTKTQLYPIAYKLQCWKPQAKQPVKQEHNPTHKKKMRWQKNMSQMKEQGKNLQHQINEEEIGNLPEKEFRIIVRMIQNGSEWKHGLRKYKKCLTRT